MTATTATTVITPMMTPRSVRNERSLWAAMARQATRRSSPTSICLLLRLGALRGCVLALDAVADLQRPERLERAGDDLLALGEAFEHLGLQVGVDAGLDLPEVDDAVLHDEDAL